MKLTKEKAIYKTITIHKEPTNRLYNNNTFVDGYQIGNTMTATFRITIRG